MFELMSDLISDLIADRRESLRRAGIVALTLLCLSGTNLGAQTPASGSLTPVETARAYRQNNAAKILLDYAELLKIPNVADDSVNIRRNAVYIADQFMQRGVEMEVLELPGAPPLIIGHLTRAGAARTIGIYAHYDGQPVDPSRWRQSPWTPTLYTQDIDAGGEPRAFPEAGEEIDPEWRLYARASGDDKVPFPCLWTALDALEGAQIATTSNFVFLFEGEEEDGSPHLAEYLRAFKDKLEADLWLIFDGPVHQSRRPQLVFGVRGITSMEITVYGASRNLHSGHYGNWAPNPAMMLAQLLASMKDRDGNVVIEGFYDSADPIGAREREALANLPPIDEALMRELGMARAEGRGEPLSERLLLPSLNVRGLESANVGDKARNVIPSTAIAAIDIRMVKGNEPEKMMDLVESHIEGQGFYIVREDPDMETRLAHPRVARVERSESGYVAARTSMDHPIVEPLKAAIENASDDEIVLMPSLGGSLPLYLFNEILERPVVIVPIANHDDNQHAPNENIRIANLWYGIDLMAGILTLPQ